LAEREGFEPSLGLTLNTLSRRAPSATQPPLQNFESLPIFSELVLLNSALGVRFNLLLFCSWLKPLLQKPVRPAKYCFVAEATPTKSGPPAKEARMVGKSFVRRK
jgi:hypothetical protein